MPGSVRHTKLGRLAACLALGTMWLGTTGCSGSSDTSGMRDGNPELEIAEAVLRNAGRLAFEGADIERGMHVMLGTERCRTSAACFSCYQCHGMAGEGSPLIHAPRLAGQPYAYLYRSLQEFAAADRPNRTMQDVAKGMSAQEMRDVSAYFAAVSPGWPGGHLPVVRRTDHNAELLSRGWDLVTTGAADAGVQACVVCHGPDGPPVPDDYPELVGQYPEYLASQLRAFRSGERRDPLQIMHFIASQLTEEQIDAVSLYYGFLDPPGTRRTADPALLQGRIPSAAAVSIP